jgi:predicted metalloenzyme YecM
MEVKMQFVRAIVESSQLESVIDIPVEFKDQKVEVLILPLPREKKKEKKEFNPDDFIGILKMDSEEIEKEIKSMRDEWERI